MVKLVSMSFDTWTRMCIRHKLGRLYTAETTFQIGERTAKPECRIRCHCTVDWRQNKGVFPYPPISQLRLFLLQMCSLVLSKRHLPIWNAGTRLVWVLEPVSKTVTVYRSETDIEMLTRDDTLTGEDVVPGFTCSVDHLFE